VVGGIVNEDSITQLQALMSKWVRWRTA